MITLTFKIDSASFASLLAIEEVRLPLRGVGSS